MSLYSLIRRIGSSGFGYGSTAEEVSAGLDLTGKCILVTGGNSGIGRKTVRVLTMRGATVLTTARSESKARIARRRFGKRAIPLICELSDPNSIQACVDNIKAGGHKLDAIIANAGVMAIPECETVHGYERHFFTNHLGHFMLVTGLLDLLKDDGRVVMVSSSAHKRAPKDGIQFARLDGEGWYGPWEAYGHSKLANLLFAKELAKRFAGTKRVAVAVHPGVIRTNLIRHMKWWVKPMMVLMSALVLKSVSEGAATQVYAAVHPDGAGFNGEYLKDCKITQPSDNACDPAMAERLWVESERIAAQFE